MNEQTEYIYTERKCDWSEQDEAEWQDLLDEGNEAYEARVRASYAARDQANLY
jgi:hypothetical protein